MYANQDQPLTLPICHVRLVNMDFCYAFRQIWKSQSEIFISNDLDLVPLHFIFLVDIRSANLLRDHNEYGAPCYGFLSGFFENAQVDV